MMLIPSAKLVDEFIRTIPQGQGMDVKVFRKELAAKYGAEVSCPVTTGFHLRTVAEAAYEAYDQGMELDEITPFWRVLSEKAPTTKKLSFGGEFVSKQRQREGLLP